MSLFCWRLQKAFAPAAAHRHYSSPPLVLPLHAVPAVLIMNVSTSAMVRLLS